MSPILNWFSHEEARYLAEALLHSLWQGALLSFVLYATLRLLPSRCANTRYLFSLFALLALVSMIFLTASLLNFEPPRTVLTNQAAPLPTTWGGAIRQALRSPSTLLSSAEAAVSARSGSQPGPALPWQAWFLSAWMLGAMAMLVRLSVHVASAQEIRHRSLPCGDETVTALVESLRRSLRISRRIGVAVSETVASPAVLGVLRPTLLLPLAVVTGLPVDALRAVLLHEMAHIRRWDYLVNLLQMLIEALLFFNPAVWWINRQIRLEREACCDALAVRHTGDGAEYVTAILHALEVVQPTPLQPALQNLAEESEPSQLLERVRRILQPSHSQKPRLSLLHFASLLILCLFLIACMREGADIAVETASKWFISDEQMQQLVEVEKTYDPLPNETAGEGTTITVSGTVRTEDGSPLPEGAQLHISSRFQNNVSEATQALENEAFQLTTSYGEIKVIGYAPGYAPFSSGPYVTEPSGTIADIEIVLSKGFEATLQFTNPQGQPVKNVTVHGYPTFEDNSKYSSIDQPYDLESDEQGKVTLPHIGNLQHRILVSADGYQMDERSLGFNPNELFVWVLRPAQPTNGIVTSKITGKPIAGAELKIVREERGNTTWNNNSPKTAKAFAVTDSVGRFTLSTLRSDTRYAFIVEASDHGPVILTSIQDDLEGIKAALGPEIAVKGTVNGDLEKLSRESYIGNNLICTNISADSNDAYHGIRVVPLEIKDGVGYFEIKDLFPGKLELTVADQRVEMPLEESISDVEIRIPTEEADAPPTRPVILRWDIPTEDALPRGSIKITLYRSDHERVSERVLPIQDRDIRIDVPVGLQISYEPYDLTGYWFMGPPPISVEPGSDPMEIHIPIIPAGSAFGRVVNADGSPAAGITLQNVTLKKSPLDRQREGHSTVIPDQPMTGPDGSFHIPNLPLAGTYLVSAQQGNNVITGPTFTLTDETVSQEITLTLPEGMDLKGQVVDEQSRPVAGLELTLLHELRNDGASRLTLEKRATEEDGSFVFPGLNPSSEHYLIGIFSSHDYCPKRYKAAFTKEPMRIQAEKGYEQSGIVLDQKTKRPVSGVTAHAFPQNTWWKAPPSFTTYSDVHAEAPSNEKGEFHFTNLAPIKYGLYLDDVTPRSDVVVRGGDSGPLTIYVTYPEWSRLKPRAAEE